MHLSTGRIIITPFTLDDLELVKRLVGDPDVVKHTGFRTPMADKDMPDLLKRWSEGATEQRGMWKVTDKETGAFIGSAMLKDTDLPHPELGYMLVKDQWGKGYATEMARAIHDYATKDLQLRHVMAGTDADNLPSINVLIKIGMQKVTDPTLLKDALCGVYFINP